MRHSILMAIGILFCWEAFSQCSVSSTDGYTINVELTPSAIVAPSSCPHGYNYNVEVDYTITYTGTPPANLYTLQGYVTCGAVTNMYFNLPNAGSNSSGSSTTNTNPYTSNTDCATATPASMGCSAIDLEIAGPGISNQTIDCSFSGSLPIELGSFTLKVIPLNGVLISWKTLSEINNDFFTIEKSFNGVDWEVLVMIPGSGNSNEPLHYRYTDEQAVTVGTYYRLKQTDFNGDFKYFQPVFVTEENPTEEWSVYPNPFENSLYIEGSAESLNDLRLYFINGKEVSPSLYSSRLNVFGVELNLSALPSGFYLIRSQDKVQRVFKK